MKYTLPRSYSNAGMCVEIPDATLRQYRSELGGTKAAVDKWLYEKGFLEEAEYKEISAKTQASKPSKREFKVDQEKAEILRFIDERLREYEDTEGNAILSNIEITNPNRIIAFSLGNANYELTLVRKKGKK